MTRPLSLRERHLLTGAGALLLVFAAWVFVASPVVVSRNESLAAIHKSDALADLLATVTYRPAEASEKQPLTNLWTRRAKTSGLSIRRLDPLGETVAVTLDDAPFAAVVGWMAELTEKEALRIFALEIGRRPAPGLVSTRITLGEHP